MINESISQKNNVFFFVTFILSIRNLKTYFCIFYLQKQTKKIIRVFIAGCHNITEARARNPTEGKYKFAYEILKI